MLTAMPSCTWGDLRDGICMLERDQLWVSVAVARAPRWGTQIAAPFWPKLMTPQIRSFHERGAYCYHDDGPSTVLLQFLLVDSSWPSGLVRWTAYPEAEVWNSALGEVLQQWENDGLTASQLSSDRLRPRLPSVTENVGWILETVVIAQLHLSSNLCNLCGTSV